jgi:hypothetical protein
MNCLTISLAILSPFRQGKESSVMVLNLVLKRGLVMNFFRILLKALQTFCNSKLSGSLFRVLNFLTNSISFSSFPYGSKLAFSLPSPSSPSFFRLLLITQSIILPKKDYNFRSRFSKALSSISDRHN